MKIIWNDCKCLGIKYILCAGYVPLIVMVDLGGITYDRDWIYL